MTTTLRTTLMLALAGASSLLFTGCLADGGAVVVDRGPRYYDRGPRYHDGYYDRGYNGGGYDRGYYGDRRSTTVVVNDRPGYYAPARSRYDNRTVVRDNRTVVRGGYQQPVRAGYHPVVQQRPGTTVVVKKKHVDHD